MHAVEIGAIRQQRGAGLFLALTRRCPLSCAHCFTDSSLSSEQYSAEPFRRLISTFTKDDRPELILMAGGEALLRAGLVRELATQARISGCRSYVLSGMYFARDGRAIPAALRRAIGSVDHFAASLDEFHEREILRSEVFAAMHQIRQLVPAVSFQLTGYGDEDRYLEGLIADIRTEFADDVPIFVTPLRPVGRGRQLFDLDGGGSRARTEPADPDPCDLAGWPLVTYDGTVYACCNQDLLDRLRPSHLILGHAGRDAWPVLRQRLGEDPVLRGIRALGPSYLADRFGERSCDQGQCGNCTARVGNPVVRERLNAYVNAPAGRRLLGLAEEMAENQDQLAFSRRHAGGKYGDLVTLGWEGTRAPA